MIESILEKLTLKQLGIHLSNYSNLYIKPVDAWKKATAANRHAYNFVVLHIVYFTVLILLNIRDTYSALQICILEISVTVIPLIIYILPYKICSLLFNMAFDWKRLFRLLLILKFQFIPLYYVLLNFSKYSGSEDIYLLFDNSIWLVWIGFTIVFPVISNLKIWAKTIFIVLNYMFFTVIMFCFVLLFPNTDIFNKLGDDIGQLSPCYEYKANEEKFSEFMSYRADNYFMLIGYEENPGLITYYDTQFVNTKLVNSFLSKVINESVNRSIELDSVICTEDKSRISKKDSLKTLYKIKEINGKILDSFRKTIYTDFKKDLSLNDSLAKHAKFKSNRIYYKKQQLYLDAYGNSYFSPEIINRIKSNAKEKYIIKLEDSRYITLLKIDSTFYNPSRLEYEIAKEKLQIRENKSNMIAYIWFYPIDKILSFCVYYD